MKAPSAAPRTRMVRITRLLGVPLPPCRVAGRGTGSSRPSLARRLRAPQVPRRSGATSGYGGRITQRDAYGVGQRPDDDRLQAVDRRGLATAGTRHQGTREPEPRRLPQPAIEPTDGAELAQQAHLADG